MGMNEPNTLDEQIREILGEEDYKYTEKPYRLLALFTEHSKQAFLLGYEAGESIANGIAKTMTWEEAKAQLKRNKGEDNE
jgi:hypothetical protein